MRPATILRLLLFLGLLFVPLFKQRFPRPLAVRPLDGAETKLERAPLRPGTWWSGAFQEKFEPWFAQRLSVRPWLVRTDNQIGMTLFGERRTATPLVEGRDRWLYEKVYLDRYNQGEKRDEGERAAVDQVRRLRDLLAERGVGCVVVVAPSKAEVYPEHLPPALVRPGRERRRTTYDRLVPKLEAAGVEVVDGRRLLLEERRRGGPPVFPVGGTHTNHYGTALLMERLLAALDRQAPGRFVTFSVRGARTDEVVWDTDNDLGRLQNLWYDRPWRGPQTHPVLERADGGGRRPARLLFVGDSFTLTFLNFLTGERLMDPGDTLYYFANRYRAPGMASSPIDPRRYDLAADLGDIDAVVLATSEYWLASRWFGFLPPAIRSLREAKARERAGR